MKTTFNIQLLMGCLLLVYIGQAMAGVYRCVDDTGAVSFSQQPCTPAQDSEEIDVDYYNTKYKPKAEVCKEVKVLAQMVFPHIAKTDSILDIYKDLGGRKNLSAGITSAVNYVFNFHHNPDARESEVVTLTHQKCLDGGFGKITEQDLPDWNKVKYSRDAPELRQELDRARYNNKTKQQIKNVCKKYDEAIKNILDRLSKPIDDAAKNKLQADKEYLEEVKRQNCENLQKK
jgi:hypothetical protein